MQEEVTQKTIALVFKSSRLTADVLKKAMKMYLEHRKDSFTDLLIIDTFMHPIRTECAVSVHS